MIYQEKFEIKGSNDSYFSKQFDILITGYRDEPDERHDCFWGKLKEFKGTVLSIDTCENAEKLHYKVHDHEKKQLEKVENKSLIPDLNNLLKTKNVKGARVCIDITTLKQGVLFLLVQLLLKEVRPAILFAAYTEPIDYKKKKYEGLGEAEEYDLYDKIIGSTNGVPGFVKRQSSREIMLIAQMGFDSQRLQTIYENLKPKRIIPVVGFPSFMPGWNLSAIKMNYMILKGAECLDMIKHCEAASPFEMYQLLEIEFHRYNQNFDIYITPLGTRPHCLGAAIFAAKNPSVYLVYDFPVEKKYRSENVLKTNIYNISKYIA